jgi:Electron transfer DM13
MKNFKIYFLIFTLLFTISCKLKETTFDEMLDIANAMIVFQGNFQSAVHSTSGTAKVITENGSRTLVLENFRTDPGPDLRVYLATSTNPTDFVELGTLKASNGTFSYTIDNAVNLEQKNHVLIWCKRFSVLFGNATLKK